MRAAVIIPARMSSTRFPGKVLAPLGGKPIVQHVYERSSACSLVGEVLVATDSPEVVRAVEGFGGRAVMTRSDHASGTDRIAEAAEKLDYDIIVNVQGDEPLIRPEVIEASVSLLQDQRADVGTMALRIQSAQDALDPNVVKVAMSDEGFALYFSRAPIPYHRDVWKDLASLGGTLSGPGGGVEVYKHIGLYSYRRQALLRLAGLSPTRLEMTEKLEQLRALENGMRIKVALTQYETIGVDTPQDLEKVKKCLSISS